ncbi:hypothetical protein ADK60_31940 [Streptomyces sp. XY431]|uniref:DUF317 domain-containing protein n=1 Tax=Streptomycetaceae TaxID=2062 RepID=UPI0006AE0A73|nr:MULTISPECIES: DUF317 domain-containing protein [Streptomycetaceae]KOV12328.1 hypothetical protein ADK60_31940 [Streptomyces sp. XY431]WSR41923.1 DUF317 domain-containing protein [Kitasatospora purpeofusca]
MRSTVPLLVQPLRLAGPGDPLLAVTPLADVHGWSRDHAPDGAARLTSPCRTAVLTGEGPTGQPGAWTVRGYASPGSEPLWRASFGPGTPAEITAAFVTVLADGLRTRHRDYLRGGRQYHPDTPASVLADRGWRPDQAPKGFHDQVAPDHTAVYRHRVGYQSHDVEVAGLAPPSWSMLAGDPKHPSWRADFTIGVPFYPLVHAARAFSDTAPVQRLVGDIPTRHLALVTVRRPSRSTPTRPMPPAWPGPSTPPASRPAPAARRR